VRSTDKLAAMDRVAARKAPWDGSLPGFAQVQRLPIPYLAGAGQHAIGGRVKGDLPHERMTYRALLIAGHSEPRAQPPGQGSQLAYRQGSGVMDRRCQHVEAPAGKPLNLSTG